MVTGRPSWGCETPGQTPSPGLGCHHCLREVLPRPRLPFQRSDGAAGSGSRRLALERLGGAWIKLGQMLAMRFDLLPPAYCDELFKLLNQVKPFGYGPGPRDHPRRARRRPGGDLPARSRPNRSRPPQSARCTAPSSTRASTWRVKVQRPGIRATLQSDIPADVPRSAASSTGPTSSGPRRVARFIDEFARWTADELDYLVEARQAVLLYEHAEGDRLERIARVYREYTTSRVLTAG